MARSQITWIAIIVISIIVSIILLYPSIVFYTQDQAALKRNTPPEYYSLKSKALRLGLDLQGGVHMVLQVKGTQGGMATKELVDQVKNILEIRIDKFGIAEPDIRTSGADQIVVDLPGYTDIDTAKALIGSTAQLQFKLLKTGDEAQAIAKAIDSVMVLALIKEGKIPERENAPPAQTPSDTAKGIESIFGEASKDTSQEMMTEEEFEENQPFSALLTDWTGRWWYLPMENYYQVMQYLERPEVQAIIPANVQVTFGTRAEKRGDRQFQAIYFLNKNIEMTGDAIVDVRENYDQMRRPVVNFELNSEGARTFGRLTGNHINEPLAIVIDGRVESAPNIQSRITKQGQITMGGEANIADAYLLAVLLKAGALPAEVELLQSTIIGPSLGQDSINKGKIAAVVGVLAVMGFLAIYYGLSGIIADIAIALNVLFVLAFMVIPGVNATLTMPGIAGLILTVGMADDANVIIFERIREELRSGKTVKAAIDTGYAKALLTIIDSHVTTLISALFLFIFGSGPVRGFAVTLSVGIFISLFTALFVTKAVFDMRKQYKSLSI